VESRPPQSGRDLPGKRETWRLKNLFASRSSPQEAIRPQKKFAMTARKNRFSLPKSDRLLGPRMVAAGAAIDRYLDWCGAETTASSNAARCGACPRLKNRRWQYGKARMPTRFDEPNGLGKPRTA